MTPHDEFKNAFIANDAVQFRRLLEKYPDMMARINEPVGPFNSPAITSVCTKEMLDVFLEAGADINARSQWWAGGFGLLDSATPELAAYAIERGALLDIHSASRLGMLSTVQKFLTANPAAVHARGGDGQTPLHFASSVEIAELLLKHGADINARDIDHESTPVQYMVRDRQKVARFLVQRGCETDVLVACALGDEALVKKHVEQDANCMRISVSEKEFPKRNNRSGGTIYMWTLGFRQTPLSVAREFGHQEIVKFLEERSPLKFRLIDACRCGRKAEAELILAEHPSLLKEFSADDQANLVHAAEKNETAKVDLMLSLGWSVDARGRHGGTALHWAAFHGNADLVEIILRYGPSLEIMDHDHKSTPMGWAIHGTDNGWSCDTGDYVRTKQLLGNR